MLQRQPDYPADLIELAIQRCRVGFRCLAEAWAYAADVGSDARQFAMDLAELQDAGLQPRDLRWLLAKGYVLRVEGNADASARPDPSRGRAGFDPADRFVATKRGLDFWAEGLRSLGKDDDETVVAVIGPKDAIRPDSEMRPYWDSVRRELRVGGTVVKRFRQPSPLQELVLTVFQEEGWPQRIADPLPRRAEQLPKRRLHDTIRSLNLNQSVPLLRFGGDGTGEGIMWEWTEAAERSRNVGLRLRRAA